MVVKKWTHRLDVLRFRIVDGLNEAHRASTREVNTLVTEPEARPQAPRSIEIRH